MLTPALTLLFLAAPPVAAPTVAAPTVAAPPALEATRVWHIPHESMVVNLHWSDDASVLAGCLDKRSAVFWGPKTGAQVAKYPSISCRYQTLTPDGRFAALLAKGPVRVIEVATRAVVGEVPFDVYKLAYHPASGTFAAATSESVYVWTSPAKTASLTLAVENVQSVRFSHGGTRLTAVTAQYWTKKRRRRLKRPIWKAITWSLPSGKVLRRRSARSIPDVPVWGNPRRKPHRSIARVIKQAGKQAPVESWLRAPVGDSVILTQADVMRVWDRKRRTPGPVLAGLDQAIARVIAISPVTDQVAVGGLDGTVTIHRTEKPPRVMGKVARYVRALAFSPDGRWLAASGQGTWAVWSLKTGAQVGQGKGSSDSLAFDAKSAVLAMENRGTELRETKNWTVTSMIEGAGWVHPSRTGFLRASSGGLLERLEPPTWTPQRLSAAAYYRRLVVLPNGHIAGPRYTNHALEEGLRVWAPDARDAIHRSKGDVDAVVALGPHGWLATFHWVDALVTTQVRLWHPATGAEQMLARIENPHRSATPALHFGDRGRGLVALDSASGVTFWRVRAR